MTIQMPELLARINTLQPIVEWWFDNRHTPTGKAMLAAEKQVHSKLSLKNGGGANPFYGSQQGTVAKTDHNKHITNWEQVVTFLEAANFSGIVNLCPWSTPQCRKHCLGHTSGRMPMTNNRIAQRVRTTHLVNHTFGSLIIMLDDKEKHARRIHKCGKLAADRPNGDSDIAWELAAWFLVLCHRAGIDQLFDYTKGAERTDSIEYNLLPSLGVHYYLAVSATERTQPADLKGGMVIIVDIKPNDPIPPTYAGYKTIDGDWTNGDLRFLDDTTKLVLIRKKGSLKKETGHWNNFCKPATCNTEVVKPDTSRRLQKQLAVTAL
jgi:hypothetical protein